MAGMLPLLCGCLLSKCKVHTHCSFPGSYTENSAKNHCALQRGVFVFGQDKGSYTQNQISWSSTTPPPHPRVEASASACVPIWHFTPIPSANLLGSRNDVKVEGAEGRFAKMVLKPTPPPPPLKKAVIFVS